VVILSGLWTQQGLEGAELTSASFDTAFDGFGSYLIPIAVFLFAISTMIAWSYYGEKGVRFLFGPKAILPYRIVFVSLVFVGAVWKLGPVLAFSDAMLGLLAVPNLIAVLLLSPKLRGLTKDYFGRLKSGSMPRYK
ncbi:MAG: AGCS family alanine or glycine:cation symporter, partial [Myxococcota bacterium]